MQGSAGATALFLDFVTVRGIPAPHVSISPCPIAGTAPVSAPWRRCAGVQ